MIPINTPPLNNVAQTQNTPAKLNSCDNKPQNKGDLSIFRIVDCFQRQTEDISVKSLYERSYDSLQKEEQRLVNLFVQIFHKEEIPSREEIKEEILIQAKAFAQDPTGYIKRGKSRELIAKNIYESLTGQAIPSKKEICQTALKYTCKSETAKDLVVNAGGLTGSIVGSTFGLPGQLIGDLTGAVFTRKVFNDTEATIQAHKSLSSEQEYQDANLFGKLAKVFNQAKEILKSSEVKEKDKKNALADTTGWVIGNSVAEGLNNTIPAISGIPLKGAAVALPTVPMVVESVQRIKSGESAKSVIPEIISRHSIKAGNKREEQARSAVKNIIKEAKSGKLAQINLIA